MFSIISAALSEDKKLQMLLHRIMSFEDLDYFQLRMKTLLVFSQL